jgi:hypothetical protein
MSNINISSGSDFSKKKFGSIVKLTKPTFVYNGKIFSNNNFRNQRTIPVLENNIYYSNHGLVDSDVIYDITEYSFNLDNQQIQSDIVSIMQFLIPDDTGPVSSRATGATLTSLSSSTNGAVSMSSGGSAPADPYDDNNPPCPPVP